LDWVIRHGEPFIGAFSLDLARLALSFGGITDSGDGDKILSA
jgi:hypothetical protein